MKSEKQILSLIKKYKYLVLTSQKHAANNKLKALLEMDPPAEWVEKHPHATKEIINEKGKKISVPVLYMPIGRIEFLLKNLFPGHSIEILSDKIAFNGAVVTVRISFKDPGTDEIRSFDGIGAEKFKSTPGALTMLFPLVKSLAIKDAADHFGRLFGSDLNRENLLEYHDFKHDENDKKNKIIELMNTTGLLITPDEEIYLNRIIENNETKSYDKALRILNERLKK